MIPVGAAFNAGRTLLGSVAIGTGRSILTTGAGVGTNFVVAPFATSWAKKIGVNDTWAKDIGTVVDFDFET